MQSSVVSSDECQASVIMRQKEPKNKEPSTPDLLNDSANVKTTLDKNRPRSCVNPTPVGYDMCPNNSRIDLENNRRWSGVQLGSKLMQAFDRLVFDDSDDYTDSLEHKTCAKTTDAKVTWTGYVMCVDPALFGRRFVLHNVRLALRCFVLIFFASSFTRFMSTVTGPLAYVMTPGSIRDAALGLAPVAV